MDRKFMDDMESKVKEAAAEMRRERERFLEVSCSSREEPGPPYVLRGIGGFGPPASPAGEPAEGGTTCARDELNENPGISRVAWEGIRDAIFIETVRVMESEILRNFEWMVVNLSETAKADRLWKEKVDGMRLSLTRGFAARRRVVELEAEVRKLQSAECRVQNGGS